MVIDFVMIVLMLVVMASRLIGNTAHELLGVSLILLFIVHHILNRQWYKTLLKGRYNALRVLHTAVNMLLLVTMLALMVSAVLISRSVFAFLDLNGGLIGRQIHLLATYWGFILMSIHLGMHWGMIMGAVRKLTKTNSPNRNCTYMLRIIAGLIAVYGVYASFVREVGAKLILYYSYDFWNYDQSAVIFFVDYLCIMGLYVCVTYYLLRLFRNGEQKDKDEKV
ncbi:MAG TPA: hypothetical protein DCZ10_00940 [Pelotomaculum sp.]|nr:hypothetical protein [Pelotomaculum sp.]